MKKICLYFHVHQPVRLNKYYLFGDQNHWQGDSQKLFATYFDDAMNRHYFDKAARQCYLPANKALLDAIEEHGGKFKVSFSATGVFFEQAEKYCPEVLESFQQLASTGCVEFLDETYYHSLASLYSDLSEFREQVEMHSDLIADLFGQAPTAFRNTEVIYNNRIAAEVEKMGYEAVLTEGIETVLGWRSPNYVYRPAGCGKLKLLMRNYKLSDDVGYRFSSRQWKEWPLTADKYASWLGAADGECVNLFMDYETFGEHHWKDTGILEFLRHLPGKILERQLEFATVTEAARALEAKDVVDVHETISWADQERDESAWLGNEMQRASFREIEQLGEQVKSGGDAALLKIWRLLQTSDHFMYFCTKSWADGDVHEYFSPYKGNNPYENFANYMNVVQDFKEKVGSKAAAQSTDAAKAVPRIKWPAAGGSGNRLRRHNTIAAKRFNKMGGAST